MNFLFNLFTKQYVINPSSKKRTVHKLYEIDGRCHVKNGKLIHYIAAMFLITFKKFKMCQLCMRNGS